MIDDHTKASKRRSGKGPSKPDPWLQRKIAISVVIGLACWSFYVVVGRVCTPMIQGRSSSGLGRSTGIGGIVGFVILWLFMITTYMKMLFVGPGFAPNHVPKAQQPQPCDQQNHYQAPMLSPPPSAVRNSGIDDTPQPSEFAAVVNVAQETLQNYRPSSDTGTEAPLKNRPIQKRLRDWRTVERPLPPLPPTVRWCQYCQINKPPRTHHCRHCGVCVMQFDHHCLWIGQCVGWGNHKVSFPVDLAKSSGTDGQVIAMIALSAMFGLFTFSMCATHIHLILTGRTTVESYARRDQQEAENRVLQHEYGYFFHNAERRKVQRKWRSEWGSTPVDARWVFGSKMDLWEQEMGRDPLGWILPIGRPLGDGIHYESNPRFGPNGEWLKKKDWPKELQT
ncbi:uncharacterized protein L201_001553 [Kwoniella dendrophila CBS 6074]|uniref:Palmitoyltransferase n=1 Tax=Kwoniella dendrophila CBS 6074 TaxID=1295534 RepID=A0AAX4JNN2_9TREE